MIEKIKKVNLFIILLLLLEVNDKKSNKMLLKLAIHNIELNIAIVKNIAKYKYKISVL